MEDAQGLVDSDSSVNKRKIYSIPAKGDAEHIGFPKQYKCIAREMKGNDRRNFQKLSEHRTVTVRTVLLHVMWQSRCICSDQSYFISRLWSSQTGAAESSMNSHLHLRHELSTENFTNLPQLLIPVWSSG